MTNREYFITQWQREVPTSVNVLKAVMEPKWDYRPDPVTKSAKELVRTLVAETGMYQLVVDGGKIDVNVKGPSMDAMSLADLTAAYEMNVKKVGETIQKMDDQMWETHQTGFYMGDKPMFTATIQDMMWMLLFDHVHHRGQLTTYLRAMGGKVPAIYGPSADDMGPMAGAM